MSMCRCLTALAGRGLPGPHLPRPSAPAPPLQCCVCPVVGGALKPTSMRGLWCHSACLQWIPEVREDHLAQAPGGMHAKRWAAPAAITCCTPVRHRAVCPDARPSACVDCLVPRPSSPTQKTQHEPQPRSQPGCPCVQLTVADVELQEPVEGVRSIPKERWDLLCSVCRQRMGAKIQCESCFTAYHPLCARVAGAAGTISDRGMGRTRQGRSAGWHARQGRVKHAGHGSAVGRIAHTEEAPACRSLFPHPGGQGLAHAALKHNSHLCSAPRPATARPQPTVRTRTRCPHPPTPHFLPTHCPMPQDTTWRSGTARRGPTVPCCTYRTAPATPGRNRTCRVSVSPPRPL